MNYDQYQKKRQDEVAAMQKQREKLQELDKQKQEAKERQARE